MPRTTTKRVSALIEAKVASWLARGKTPRRITLHRVDFEALVRELGCAVDRWGTITAPLYWQSGEHSIRVVSGCGKSYRPGYVHLL